MRLNGFVMFVDRIPILYHSRCRWNVSNQPMLLVQWGERMIGTEDIGQNKKRTN